MRVPGRNEEEAERKEEKRMHGSHFSGLEGEAENLGSGVRGRGHSRTPARAPHLPERPAVWPPQRDLDLVLDTGLVLPCLP